MSAPPKIADHNLDQAAATALSPLPVLRSETVVDFFWQLQLASRSRPTFDLATAGPETRRPVRLSTGPSSHQVFAIPAPLALCGPQQFVQFTREFGAQRDVLVLSVPGFTASERLPASFDVAIRHQAEVVRANVSKDKAAPILMGYSTGGVMAYAVGKQLESMGFPVAAVVMLDSFRPALTEQISAMMIALINDPDWRPLMNETRLTAMGWYSRALSTADLTPIDAPALMVRAKVPMSGVAAESDWRPSWPFPHDTVDVDGDHFSMIQDFASTAASAVEAWLRSTLN